jgi:hypothetical protein
MIIRPIAAISLILLLAASSQAQDAQAPEESTENNDTAAATQPATEEPAPSQRDDSPFDYKSSEEISEDLSVSFPVDI